MKTLLEEMEDDGMEDMVGLERPMQIINLFIEDQIDNIMFGKLFNSDDLDLVWYKRGGKKEWHIPESIVG